MNQIIVHNIITDPNEFTEFHMPKKKEEENKLILSFKIITTKTGV